MSYFNPFVLLQKLTEEEIAWKTRRIKVEAEDYEAHQSFLKEEFSDEECPISDETSSGSYSSYSTDNLTINDPSYSDSRYVKKKRRKLSKIQVKVEKEIPQLEKVRVNKPKKIKVPKPPKIKKPRPSKSTRPDKITGKSVTFSLSCPVCHEETVQTPRNHTLHLLSHVQMISDDSKSVICPVPTCQGKIWDNQKSLRRHIRRFHISLNQRHDHSCPICPNLSFSSGLKLLGHVKSVHPTDRYLCPHCAASLLHPTALKSHIRNIHQKIHHCPLSCGKRFDTTEALDIHIEGCNGKLIQQCHICSKQFRNKTRFKEHMNSHDPSGKGSFTCTVEECSRVFYNHSDFKRHKRSHTGERRFICDQCPKTYTERNKLTKHLREVHDGDRPTTILCPECGMFFKKVAQLEKHIDESHTIKGQDFCADQIKCEGSEEEMNDFGD